jgi:signal transduction histidine kinase
MEPREGHKWRPSIGLVVLAILLTVMALPLVGLLLFRLYGSGLMEMSGAELFLPGVVIAAATVLGVTLLIGFVFIRAITRPMHELIDRTSRIAAGDRAAIRPLSRHGTSEMAELSGAFLDMAGKLQTRSDMIRTFATHVSHELKSPLTAIQGAAELLRDAGEEMEPATRARFHANILADAERLNRLVRRLIELARAESAGMTGETTSLAEVVGRLGIDGLAIAIDAGADIRFAMSAENAAIVFSNLADNSAQHGASVKRLAATRVEGTVMILASDDGAGIAPATRDRIFEAFFTTRRESGGTGLGLGIVAALLKAHEGTIRLADAATGSRFDIELPAA